jgi:AcrR family transcriptional regulator
MFSKKGRKDVGTPGRKKNPEKTTATRNKMLETSYELFSEKTIESVTMSEIARKSGYRDITVYRYFSSKPSLVVSVATRKWEQFQQENESRRPVADFEGMTAAEIFEFYLDSFLELYKNRIDLLRFNQFFNVYVQSECMDEETMKPYQDMIDRLQDKFHVMYAKAEQDKTIRTDCSEKEMFSTTLHLMMAAITRYAVGLVYIPENGFDPLNELEAMKDALLLKYKN